jgi:S-adenosylmethionine:tRNA ribosyltransferase-isomerase
MVTGSPRKWFVPQALFSGSCMVEAVLQPCEVPASFWQVPVEPSETAVPMFEINGREARGPVELLTPGAHRDDVRLLVSGEDGHVQHAAFYDLDQFLAPADLVVVNDSATLPAALAATLRSQKLLVHVSSAVPNASKMRLVELRLPVGIGSDPFGHAHPGDTLALAGGGTVALVTPLHRGAGSLPRLWEAHLALPSDFETYLTEHGRPIRYPYVSAPWPLPCYQTIFARRPGSSEMPSAGRPFSLRVLRRLQRRGVRVGTITLHTGVASLEADEKPQAEFFAVSSRVASLINRTRERGGRVIGVGTTVVRALESATDGNGRVCPTRGFTDLVITREHHLRVVDALITGLHEPHASHIRILQALAADRIIADAYAAAIDEGYVWHEFGDVHLLWRHEGRIDDRPRDFPDIARR